MSNYLSTRFSELTTDNKVQFIMDCSKFKDIFTNLDEKFQLQIEVICRKMCFALHGIRSKSVTSNKRKGKIH